MRCGLGGVSHLRRSPVCRGLIPQAAHGYAALACGYWGDAATPLVVERAGWRRALRGCGGMQVKNLHPIE